MRRVEPFVDTPMVGTEKNVHDAEGSSAGPPGSYQVGQARDHLH
jgi:hypothetical protein